ncbi:MAG: Asp-tRNA(Asn)/Glu-tRNA(Gln) amidotransferase subunit GatB [Oscillospiraceae bacterium]|nr:Asp-tRNA(Asn)/Glu-tRNA(Gln) amidotransferase subunit GatB [Oscillospiraceae bacterium]
MAREDYEIVIGLETHIELGTKTKIFCNCSTEFGGEPNAHTCPVCLALPGATPVLNEKVVEYAVKAGLATNCTIPEYTWQNRKNYLYPDMSPGYQVSQTEDFICQNGYIEIDTENGPKKIRIYEIHIETDAGKLVHGEYTNSSLVDLNRAGVPLAEIVSEPDLRSSEEVEKYLRSLKAIMEYIGVSDCKMQEGSMRADINLSVRKKGDPKYGNRTEMKNMNSFKFIVKAIEYEALRQIDILEDGGEVPSETVRWDEVSQKTIPMRDKDSAAYRPFPDPELAPIVLTKEYVENIRESLPELPEVRKKRYIEEYGLPEYDSKVITASKHFADLFEGAAKICNNPKAVSNWIMTEIIKVLNDQGLEPADIPFSSSDLGNLIILIDNGTISGGIGKKVLAEMFENPKAPEVIVKEKGWVQISDEGAIKEVVLKVLENNPQSVADYKAGKDKALGFLVGQAMKETRGQGNPGMLNKMFLDELKK